MTEKLQKILANRGLGSRRQMETWIEAGRVKVNGKLAKLGDRASTTDLIRIDGRELFTHNKPILHKTLIYNKPEGEICTRKDPEGRPTVFQKLPKLRGRRWIAIGRLDINSSGLLIFTTDGELANRWMHPSQEVEREYAVRVLGKVTPAIIERLTKGVKLEDGMAKFDEIKDAGGTGANHWYHVILKEGRQREVRRLFASQGLTVSRLIRIRYGNVALPPRLKAGKFEDIETRVLASQAHGVTV